MPDTKNKLFLYEALELRAEYDARIKTLKDCLPETKQNRERFSFSRDDTVKRQPAPDFDIVTARELLRKLELKRRKLNSAIQQANFNNHLEFGGNPISLSEALEIRKGLNERLGELHAQVVSSAYQKVIYKEGRDIVEQNDLPYNESVKALEEARFAFRDINRKLRSASFTTIVDFEDE
jgi:hypothetical protein